MGAFSEQPSYLARTNAQHRHSFGLRNYRQLRQCRHVTRASTSACLSGGFELLLRCGFFMQDLRDRGLGPDRNSFSVAPAPSNCPVPRRISFYGVRRIAWCGNWGFLDFPRFWTPEPLLATRTRSLTPLWTWHYSPLAFPSTSTPGAGCNAGI